MIRASGFISSKEISNIIIEESFTGRIYRRKIKEK